ncbi:MAG TPA: L-ribulose-5-phosphate 4-epimerase [Candidatus Acidoferrum sp.]|nr:L-ribulose-5-phosphate 4-epimerase [Candidatus Acidoferrum sp.]
MLLPELRRQVLEANLELVRRGLVPFTFGNASGISRQNELVVIKPSGVPYERMKPADLVVTDLNGKIVEGKLRPSSDLPTHLILYKSFPGIGGVSHTHSEYATAWAQARRPIPCFGTTHADTFHGPVPVTAELKDAEIAEDYEANTGRAIVRMFRDIDYSAIPGVLVANHAPFTWGLDAMTSAHNAAVLEFVARMAYFTLGINAEAGAIARSLHDKHFLRKHGKEAYYGQPKEKK